MNHLLLCIVWNAAFLAGERTPDASLKDAGTDTANVVSAFSNRVEVRVGTTLAENESEVSFEFRHSWFPFLSTDLYVSSNAMRGIGLGLSVDPISILSFQGCFGLSSYTDRVVDGPVFDPEYTYSVRGAFLIPLDVLQSRFYLSLSGGKTWVVDTNYNPATGFPPPRTDDTIVPSATRQEIRTVEFVELGVGIRF